MSVYGRRSSKSIGEVAYYKPLAMCGMEELAARQRTIEPSGGILFARNRDREAKDVARQAIIDLFAPERWPDRLHMLTLPGLDWRFERLLLASREVGWLQARNPQRTLFTSVENDRSIYFAAAAQMPGTETPDRVIKTIRSKTQSFYEHGVNTRYAAFFFADVDDLMRQSDWSGWDAVWLDYTGPLTVERLELIKTFFHKFVHDTLIVTALQARWNESTSRAIAKAGSHSHWLRQNLFGEILHEIEYIDTVPMAQFAVRHPIENLGLFRADAHAACAEIAAGLCPGDTQGVGAGGTNDLGQSITEIRPPHAGIAAASHTPRGIHRTSAGGTNSHDLGQEKADAHVECAEIAAAGQLVADTHHSDARGGTIPEERTCRKNPKREKTRHAKRMKHSKGGSPRKNVTHSQQVKNPRLALRRKPSPPSAPTRRPRKLRARRGKQNS